MKDKKKDRVAKPFNKLNHPIQPKNALVFLRREKCLKRTNGELREQSLACFFLVKCTGIDENQIPSRHHGVWDGH